MSEGGPVLAGASYEPAREEVVGTIIGLCIILVCVPATCYRVRLIHQQRSIVEPSDGEPSQCEQRRPSLRRPTKARRSIQIVSPRTNSELTSVSLAQAPAEISHSDAPASCDAPPEPCEEAQPLDTPEVDDDFGRGYLFEAVHSSRPEADPSAPASEHEPASGRDGGGMVCNDVPLVPSATIALHAAAAAATRRAPWVGATVRLARPGSTVRADALSGGLPALSASFCGPLPQGTSRHPEQLAEARRQRLCAQTEAFLFDESRRQTVPSPQHEKVKALPIPSFEADAHRAYRLAAMDCDAD
jgi:hypothetical protein